MSATRKVTAHRLAATAHFDMSAVTPAADGTARIPVLPPSGFTGRDGRGPFNYDIAVVTANVRANGADVPVFLDHLPGKAFGWLNHQADPVQMADGSWEWEVRYTDEGAQALASAAYRYNSPTYLFRQDPSIQDRQAGQVVGLLEVSLTNLPNLYLRSLNSAEAAASYTVELPLSLTENEAEMNKEQLEALGLAEDAAPEAVLEAINSLKTAAAKANAIVEAAGADADADAPAVVDAAANSRVASGVLVTKQAYDEVVTAKNAAEAAVLTAENALATLKAEQAVIAVNSAVDAAITAGKFTPAEREECVDYASSHGAAKFTAWAAKRTAHAAARPLATPAEATENFGLTPEQLAMCKKEEINPEIFAQKLRKNQTN
jgi:phage I-like protein